jgi:hypothetical protein
MRRLLTVAGLALLAAFLPMSASHAAALIAPPPLDIQLYVFLDEDGKVDHASLHVEGRGCSPQNAPASVTVTLDRLPGEVFTATPNAKGRWQIDLPVQTPVDGVFVVNATCDNYFGQGVYPTAQTDADQIIVVSSGGNGSGGSGGPPPTPTPVDGQPCPATDCLANTGNDTKGELGTGVLALLVGGLLVLIGRPRVAAVRSGAYGRSVIRHRN